MKNIKLQHALSDLEIIKQVIYADGKDSLLIGITLKSNIVLLSIAAFCSLGLCALELMTGGTMTNTLLSAVNAQELKTFGIGFMAVILASLIVVLYFILWRASKHNGEEYSNYISRNFSYFKSASLMSDLLMKFIAVSFLVLANKPEWISLLLTAFIGDYLLQGRLFKLPTKVSVVSGLMCFAMALFMFTNTIGNLLIPLIVFALAATISLVWLLGREKSIDTSSEII